MNTELDGEGMIIDPANLEQGQLPELSLGTRIRQPPSVNPFLKQVPDPPHGDLPLLLHRLIVIGRHEQLPSSLFPVEQIALHHQSVEPVPILRVVPVEESPHLLGVESAEALAELRRGVLETYLAREGEVRWKRRR